MEAGGRECDTSTDEARGVPGWMRSGSDSDGVAGVADFEGAPSCKDPTTGLFEWMGVMGGAKAKGEAGWGNSRYGMVVEADGNVVVVVVMVGGTPKRKRWNGCS